MDINKLAFYEIKELSDGKDGKVLLFTGNLFSAIAFVKALMSI